jgi:hypothetical protein
MACDGASRNSTDYPRRTGLWRVRNNSSSRRRILAGGQFLQALGQAGDLNPIVADDILGVSEAVAQVLQIACQAL